MTTIAAGGTYISQKVQPVNIHEAKLSHADPFEYFKARRMHRHSRGSHVTAIYCANVVPTREKSMLGRIGMAMMVRRSVTR